MTIKFEKIKKDDAPNLLKNPKQEYKPLFHAIEDMDKDEVMVVDFEDKNHMSRTASAAHHYFGRGVVSFRRCNRRECKYVIMRVDNNQSLKDDEEE